MCAGPMSRLTLVIKPNDAIFPSDSVVSLEFIQSPDHFRIRRSEPDSVGLRPSDPDIGIRRPRVLYYIIPASG